MLRRLCSPLRLVTVVPELMWAGSVYRMDTKGGEIVLIPGGTGLCSIMMRRTEHR